MFVLFSRLFGHFQSLAFLKKWGGGGGGGDRPYSKAVKQDIFCQFFKSTKNVKTNLTAYTVHIEDFFNKNCFFWEKVLAFWTVF